MSDSPGSLREQLSILYGHRKKMLCFFVGAMMLVVLGIVFCPRTYESQAKLHVLIGRENISLDPTATTGQTINMMDTREHEINTVKDLLLSRTVLDDVVTKLGAENILAPKRDEENEETAGSSWASTVYDWMLKVNLADPVGDKERAMRRLASDIKVTSEPDSNVITVAFRSATPQMAREIGDEFLKSYHAQHVTAHNTQGSESFFSEQSEILSASLAEAEQRLRDAKNDFGIVTIGSSQLTLSKEIELVEMDLLTTSVAMAASQAKVESLTKSLQQIPERLVVEEITESSYAADEMRRTLYDLQIQENALAAKHTDEHPSIVAIREQVAASKALLDEEEKRRVQPTSSLNPASQQQKLALLNEQAVISGLSARRASLEANLSELREKLEKLNGHEILIAELERSVSLLQEDYMEYARNEELARIDQALDSLSISNVNVAQPPTFVERPVSPPKAIILVLGLALASFGSLSLALLCESLADAPLEDQKDVEAALGAPVLETIPQLQGASVTAE